jgi:hypothetical protein
MDGSPGPKQGAPKMMLGFIVRRCAADIGHTPTADEFAAWANVVCLREYVLSPGASALRLDEFSVQSKS